MTTEEIATVGVIIGMALITVVTRSFFFLTTRPWTLPEWAQRGLCYAPVAALASVIAPELVLSDGRLITDWADARLFSLAAALSWYVWRRGVLGMIVAGMAVYLPLHILGGW